MPDENGRHAGGRAPEAIPTADRPSRHSADGQSNDPAMDLLRQWRAGNADGAAQAPAPQAPASQPAVTPNVTRRVTPSPNGEAPAVERPAVESAVNESAAVTNRPASGSALGSLSPAPFQTAQYILADDAPDPWSTSRGSSWVEHATRAGEAPPEAPSPRTPRRRVAPAPDQPGASRWVSAPAPPAPTPTEVEAPSEPARRYEPPVPPARKVVEPELSDFRGYEDDRYREYAQNDQLAAQAAIAATQVGPSSGWVTHKSTAVTPSAPTPPATSQPTPAPVVRGAQASIAIEARGLQKRFKDTVAVADVSFSVPAGSVFALLGPNGAGKTTTVNMLCTLLRPDGGHATVAGHDVAKDAAAVRKSIMLTGQFAALDESLTGRENLVLFGRLLGLSKNDAKQRADDLLEAFELTEAGGKRVGQYSGGMRRRIDIACGLVTSPDVVFLDEPTTGLDPRSRLEVWSLVGRLRDQGVTTLLTTQYLEEADVLSDYIVVIDHGRVIAQGTADELKAQTGAAYCEVTPRQPADLGRLHSLVADMLPTSAQLAAGDTTIAVPAPRGADTLVEIVRRTTEAGIELADIAMRRPSLDEVFLTLTEPSQPNGHP